MDLAVRPEAFIMQKEQDWLLFFVTADYEKRNPC